MKMVKSLILGSAAGLVAMSGAQAADLPVKAKPVEYVKVCSLYGAGFWYIPGTDTCIKLGGYLSVQSFFNAGISESPAWNGDIGQHNRFAFNFSSRSRFGLTIDTRTATEYGVVRTFAEAGMTFDSLGSNTNNPTTLAGLQGAPGTLLNTAGGGFAVLNFAFIQFAGFTFGKSASAFATPWHGFPGNTTAFLLGGHDTVNGVNNIQYTAQFGNGVSGTIGLDEGLVFNRTVSANLAVPLSASGALTNAYAGQRVPDIVGNIRVDQAWGLFQISAAAHEVSGSYNTLTGGGTIGASAAPTNLSELSGHPDSKWGGAVMAALQIKNLPTGAGDDIKFDMTYAKGDTKQVISSASTSPSFIMFGGTSLAGAYQSVGFGATTDAVWLPRGLTTAGFTGGDGALHLTTSFGLRGAFNHNWDPYWSSSLFGSFSAVRYDDVAKANICAALIAVRLNGFRSADFSCNPDFNIAQVGVITRWTPVKGLAFSGEVMWTKLDQKFTGAAALTPAAPKPTAIYQFRDQSTVSTMLRVQRNF